MEGDLQAAKSLYLQALEENPDDSGAWQMLAVLHFEFGETADAVRCNGRALALDPESAAALNTAGNIDKSQGRLDQAVFSFERALAVKPDLPQALTNLADCLRLLGRLEDALAPGQKAVYLAPDMAAAHGNLAAIQLDSGETESAAAGFERALALAPEDTILRINLARALARMGDGPRSWFVRPWPETQNLLMPATISETSSPASADPGKASPNSNGHWRSMPEIPIIWPTSAAPNRQRAIWPPPWPPSRSPYQSTRTTPRLTGTGAWQEF